MYWRHLIVLGCLIAAAASPQAQDRITDSIGSSVTATGQEVRLEKDGGTYRDQSLLTGQYFKVHFG
jgi:hypothetical protein